MCLMAIPAAAQTLEVKPSIDAVTVFRTGAQVFSTHSLNLPQGASEIRFTGLSPDILAQSIQFQASGPLTVLSVNLQQNNQDESQKSDALKDLEDRLQKLEEAITLEETYIAILQEEAAFLQANRQVGAGSSGAVSTSQLQQMLDYYSQKLTGIRLKEIERNQTLEEFQKERTALQKQIEQLTGVERQAAGEILVRVNAQAAGQVPVSLSFVTNSARWTPSYDIRAERIGEPIALVYKANITQNSRMDWKDVRLTLSTANPRVSGTAPVLHPHYLRQPSPVNTMRKQNQLDEIAIVALEAAPLGVSVVDQPTTLEFQIDRPFTVPSDNKTHTVTLNTHMLEADFHYLSIPKLDPAAFLIAEVRDWSSLNLLSGPANLFFENTYVGRSQLRTDQLSDTLSLSMGRDPHVVVERKKVQEYNRKQFIGNRQEETRSWQITVRNHKNQPIDMVLLDQIPLSGQSDIDVSVQNRSQASIDPASGEVRWEFSLAPNAQKTVELEYMVKYPKNINLIIP